MVTFEKMLGIYFIIVWKDGKLDMNLRSISLDLHCLICILKYILINQTESSNILFLKVSLTWKLRLTLYYWYAVRILALPRKRSALDCRLVKATKLCTVFVFQLPPTVKSEDYHIKETNFWHILLFYCRYENNHHDCLISLNFYPRRSTFKAIKG